MEFKNNKEIKNFISDTESKIILNFIDNIKYTPKVENIHIKTVAFSLKGNSYIYDITSTDISRYLSKFQSDNNVSSEKLDPIFISLLNRISDKLNISKDNVFLQIVDMNEGGIIRPHYDTSVSGFINYKCNISVLSEDYTMILDKEEIKVKERNLYCFEASLFKHYIPKPFSKRRVLLSYGFILPYHELNRNSEDYRVRLSERIQKYFQK